MIQILNKHDRSVELEFGDLCFLDGDIIIITLRKSSINCFAPHFHTRFSDWGPGETVNLYNDDKIYRMKEENR